MASISEKSTIFSKGGENSGVESTNTLPQHSFSSYKIECIIYIVIYCIWSVKF